MQETTFLSSSRTFSKLSSSLSLKLLESKFDWLLINKCRTFLILMSRSVISQPWVIRNETMLMLLRLAASSSGDRISLSNAFMSALLSRKKVATGILSDMAALCKGVWPEEFLDESYVSNAEKLRRARATVLR